MSLHQQLILADPRRGDGHNTEGEPGDCWRTCIANVIGLHPSEVPNFVKQYSWMAAARLWLAPMGLDYGQAPSPEAVLANPEWYPDVLIATGPSPRGDFLHCVLVDRNLELLHDPHPSGLGITSVNIVEIIMDGWLWPRPYVLELEAAA